MSRAGRPRVLDETKRREICALVTAGAGVRRAAQYVGCSHSTICREAQRDERFREQLRRAKATQLLSPLQAMRQAVQSNWRAAAWMLERSDPDQYGRRHRNSFGRKELNALGRDLMAILRDEIDHPILRERIEERVQAAINYAMRHAWDADRSGRALKQAMEYFAKKNETRCDLSPFDFSLDGFAELSPDVPERRPDIATAERSDFAKLEGSDDELAKESSENAGLNGQANVWEH